MSPICEFPWEKISFRLGLRRLLLSQNSFWKNQRRGKCVKFCIIYFWIKSFAYLMVAAYSTSHKRFKQEAWLSNLVLLSNPLSRVWFWGAFRLKRNHLEKRRIMSIPRDLCLLRKPLFSSETYFILFFLKKKSHEKKW